MPLSKFTILSPSQSLVRRNVGVLDTIPTLSGPTSLDHNSPDFNDSDDPLVFSGAESDDATASDIPNTPPRSGGASWKLIRPSSSLSGGDEDDPLEDTAEEIAPRSPHGTGSSVGQKGSERCRFCRDKRRPCIYVKAKDKCDRCQKLGLDCGDKLLPPKALLRKSRSEQLDQDLKPSPSRILPLLPLLPSPDDARFTDLEARYLHYIQSRDQFHYGPCRTSVYDINMYASDLLIPAHKTYFPFSSKVLRYSILAFTSAWKAGTITDDTKDYLAKYYKYVQPSFIICAYAEILYSAYVLVRMSVLFNEPLNTIIQHMEGMSACLEYFSVRTDAQLDTEQLCMERVWIDVLTDFYYRNLRDARHEGATVLEGRVDRICEMLEKHWDRFTKSLWLKPIEKLSLPVLQHKVRTIEVYFWYYFMRYLLAIQLQDAEKLATATVSLRQVLLRMISLGENLQILERFDDIVERVPTFGVNRIDRTPKQLHLLRLEKAYLSLYLWALVINGTIPGSATKQITGQGHFGATGLLHMYRPWAILQSEFHFDTCSYNDARNLFLAGLVLNPWDFPEEHGWIVRALEPCLRGGTSYYQLHSLTENEIAAIPELLTAAGQCESMADIWSLKVKGARLWECIVGFSWMWGLDIINRV